MMHQFKKNISHSLLVLILIGGIFALSPRTAHAIPVEDIPAAIARSVWAVISKSGAVILNNVLRTAVNQLAYDAATRLGSGGEGQKPLFDREDPWKRVADAGKAGAGQFIEELSKTGLLGEDQEQFGLAGHFPVLTIKNERVGNLNLCAPDILTMQKITLGLTNYGRPDYTENACSYNTLKAQWFDEEGHFLPMEKLKSVGKDPDAFLKSLSDSFDPGGSDISTSLILFGELYEKEKDAKDEKTAQNNEDQGWLRIKSPISGKNETAPGSVERQLAEVSALQTGAVLKYTGDVFVDAANVFLNQLALSAFNKLINSIGKSDTNNGGVGNQYAQGGTGGVASVNRQASSILQAQFSDKTDYDILGQLTSCQDENKPGPTNCVISQSFAQAITKQLTVAKAIELDFIDKTKRLGFDQQGNDLSYLNGYPYRSLLILRKYRIIPVGWEVAAQYIKDHPQTTKNVTLGDLVSCYDKDDASFPGFYEEWCRGLVDPGWVLKIPKLYCGMQGYGPEIMNSLVAASETGYCAKTGGNCAVDTRSGNCATDTPPKRCNADADCSGTYAVCNFTISKEAQIVRGGDYCADEQSCIKENPNGSCAYYGYCTEEKRRWTFDEGTDSSCEARNNTCQTFKSNDGGTTASFLQNTLDYSNCGANEVGCRQYVMSGVYDSVNAKLAWNPSTGSRYFNKNMGDCDPSREGCRQFIRTKDDLDTNLIADGSFEESRCIGGNGGSETLLPKDNSLIKTAQAQVSLGTCELANFNSSGIFSLPTPNDHWSIRVNSGSAKAGIVNDRSNQNSSGQSLYIEGAAGLYSKDSGTPTILPSGFAFEADRYYTLSASVYVVSGKVQIGFGAANNGQSAESTAINSWQTLIVSYYRPANGATDFYIQGADGGAKFYIDGVKLTIGAIQNSYSNYLSNNTIYEKLLPNYLESLCYENPSGGTDYRFKDNAPLICFNFARKCNADEVGCEQYSSLNSGIGVTAKTKPKDTCPSSCVGYDVFVEQPTNFSPRQSAYFIPSTARTCGAQATGCTAFTNLDKLSEGGEAIEHFSYLRNCIKPDVSQCGQFYTWEGSDESGYQLKVYSLKKNGNEPASTLSAQEENLLCNADIYKKLPSDIGYNYDCREFYDQNGNVSYHLYTKTVTCSDDCHPYRREVATAQECTAGGGNWDATQSRCLYFAIPSEGTTCAAQDNGCREYTGNIASNTQTVLNDTFEGIQNPTNGWSGGTQSNTSLNLGGHSLLSLPQTTLTKTIGTTVKQDQSYTISFLAKSQNANRVSVSDISFLNGNNQAAVFESSGISIEADWKLFTFNLSKLNHEVTPTSESGRGGEQIRISFASPVYIDNIRITEVPNRYYLLKDSWQTPDECDQDINGAYSPRYMLGCSQYKKAEGSTVNLHGFTQLCQDSAAGCEQMIDTQNSKDYKKSIYKDDNFNGVTDPTDNNGVCDTGELSCVAVPADSVLNVVYDKSKECGQENKGCTRFGLATSYDQTTTYSDAYKLSDPDKYNTTLCASNAVGCSQWNSIDGSTTYFKDPGDMTCEWREKKDSPGIYAWLKKKVKRCDGDVNGLVCSTNGQCAANELCTLVDVDSACAVTTQKTLGEGGAFNKVQQPSEWAGTCATEQSSCTEYIDPVSSFNGNLVLNPNCTNTQTGSNICAEPWVGGTANAPAYQTVTLDLHTTYILKGGTDSGSVDEAYLADCTLVEDTEADADIYQLDAADNNFKKTEQPNTSPISGHKSTEFYISASSETSPAATATCRVWRKNQTEGKSVQLRRAIVAYQLARNLDRTSPNGLSAFSKGFILFNERSQNGSQKQALRYNADQTIIEEQAVDGTTPKVAPPPLNANVILKVQPDRTCGKWLACNMSLPDPNNPSKQTCLDVGLCDALDSEGNCSHFISAPARNQDISNASFANLSGYSKIGYRQGTTGTTLMTDYYNLANMTQGGETVNQTFDGGFENYDSNWTGSGLEILVEPSKIANANLNPFHSIKAKDADATYLPPVGRGIGMLDTGSSIEQSVSLSAGSKYTISAYIYTKSSGDAGIKLVYSGGTKNLISMSNGPRNLWTRKTFTFTAPLGTNYKIQLFTGQGVVAYFDDIQIATSLNYRCSANGVDAKDCTDPNSNSAQPYYTSPSCRLYAKQNSLSCRDEDNNSIVNKGLQGYCLEVDPKNPDTCLLWYPIDKIASERNDEGVGLNLPPLYYCVDAVDRCKSSDATTPELFCNKFIKVNSDLAWYDRLRAGSDFKASASQFFNDTVLYPSMTVNLGNKYDREGRRGVAYIPELGADNYYGASTSYLSTGSIVNLNSNGDLNTYIPYWFPDYIYSNGSYSDSNINANMNRTYCATNSSGGHLLDRGRSQDTFADDSAFVLNTNKEIEDCATNCNNDGCFKGGLYNCWNQNDGDSNSNNWWVPFRYSATKGNSTAARAWVTNNSDNSVTINKSPSDNGIRAYFSTAFNIKDFKVVKSFDKGLDLVRRLFPSSTPSNANPWILYKLSGNTYVQDSLPSQPALVPCLGNVRPAAYQGNGGANSDYCYVLPSILTSAGHQFTINNQTDLVVASSQVPVVLKFETKTDVNQLPIEKIELLYGYNVGGTEKALPFLSGVGDSNPRYLTQAFDYNEINTYDPGRCALAYQRPAISPSNLSCGAKPCCIIQPAIKITDNWGYYNGTGGQDYSGYVRVEQSAQ